VKWYKLWNILDEDSAKLMEGIYKTGVLGVEAKPGQSPWAQCLLWVISEHQGADRGVRFASKSGRDQHQQRCR
jgi:hypothetical protein